MLGRPRLNLLGRVVRLFGDAVPKRRRDVRDLDVAFDSAQNARAVRLERKLEDSTALCWERNSAAA